MSDFLNTPDDGDNCPDCGEPHPKGSLDTAALYAMAEQVELPPDVREHLQMAGVAIETLIAALKDQTERFEPLRMLVASMIYEAGGAIYVSHKTLVNCPSDITIERTEPYNRDGCMYRVNMQKWGA